MYQVNRLFLQQNLARQFFRNVYPRKPVKILYPLESRSLLKICGDDAPGFLQGLITNDMQHFEDGASSMYAMFLNNKGRVLYDILIHKWQGNDSFLLECDKNVHSLVQKHLKTYKLKRNVEIGDVSADLKLFALITPTEVEVDTTIDSNKKVNTYKDPRLPDLGHRVIATTKASETDVETSLGDDIVIANDETGYRYCRYKLGVSEGIEDLPPGTCFPLEANCDYLHGVSFHKGCYIGQEVTARVHHTGVVRKRIMPLRFTDIVTDEIAKDSIISIDNEKKTNVGKFKSCINDYGLGLIRVKEALEANALKIEACSVEVLKPSWWPIEAPKEKASSIIE